MAACKCGCGGAVGKRKVFVNKEHQLSWMANGGAREMNLLQSEEAKSKGGHAAGANAAASGRLRDAGLLGAARSREIATAWRAAASRDQETEDDES
jgi:hypothetical protein